MAISFSIGALQTTMHSFEYPEDCRKLDILTELQDAGVEFIVYNILHKLSFSDICSVFQVCSNWNSWDSDFYWNYELKSLVDMRPELKQVLVGIECPKLGVQSIVRLQKCWRETSNTKISVMMETSVLTATCHGTRVYCGLNSGEVAVCDIKDGKEIRRKELHNKGIKVVTFLPNTEIMVSGSYDGTVKLWDNNWSQVRTIVLNVAVTDIAFANISNSHVMLVTGDEGCVTCFSCDGYQVLWSVSGGEMVNCVVTWQGHVVTGSDAGNLDMRSADTGQVDQSLTGHDRGCGISGLAVSHLGLWSASFDCKMRLWNSAGDCLCVLIGHTNPVRCMTVDRSRVVSGDYRGFVMIWDMVDIEEELWKHKLKQKKSKCTKTQTPGIYKMQGRQVIRTGGDTCEVLQHSSLLEHHGNVTAVVLSGANILISCSRDRSFNIHHFNHVAKTKNYERKSYL